MVKKIIITGGLGYIGTELCKIYSGFSWHHKIIILDNRFISERVNQIRNWNMEFIHGDILDKELVNKHFHNADIVHHLAGITEVPRTKSESLNKKGSLQLNEWYAVSKPNNIDGKLCKDFDSSSKPNLIFSHTKSNFFSICATGSGLKPLIILHSPMPI